MNCTVNSLLSTALVLLVFTLPAQKAKSNKATPAPTVGDSVFFKAFKFRNVGPTRGGRVTTVTGIPEQPGTFYMGATGGGVWKTTDYGITWSNVSDGFFSTPSIGAIRVAPSKPEVVYVGTGSDGIRSNVIIGKGVYKSTDAGKTWKHMGLTNAGQIGAVEIHPANPDIAFVAAIGQPFQPNKERGVYRTQDGGKTWQQVLYHSDTVGAVDLEFAPSDPNIVYATLWRGMRKPWTIISGGEKAGGVYKSADGGNTWKKIEEGLPQGLIGKIDLAVSAADPKRVYALVEAPKGEEGLYRSDDFGNSFKRISGHKGLMDRPFYYCNVDANPLNADIVYVNSTSYYKSTNGGVKWTTLRTPHGDNHDMWINPKDTSIYIQSNDGGANVTMNSGKTWSTQDNQPTAELYQIEVDDQYPYWIYAGQQDNTTIAVPSVPPSSSPAGAAGFWTEVGGCETGPAVPKRGDPNIVYSNCKGRFGVYDKRTGQERQYYVGASNMYGHLPTELKYRFQRVSPIYVSIHNPGVVYHCSQFVHKTTDEGITWETISPDLTAYDPSKQVISGEPITRDVTGEEFYSTIYDINESPLKEGLLWVGANDGPVHVTQDGGKTWTNVSPKDMPGGGRVDCVEPSAHKEGKAYFATLRYQLGDWRPYIYKTTDYGKSWTLLTTGKNGIPADHPVRVVREDPKVEGLLYAGTEYGLFISTDDGATWKSFQQNLPVTPITDIKLHRNDLIVSTMGRSFWILDNVSALHQLKEARAVAAAYLFSPMDAYRYRYRGTGSNDVPSYPTPGVVVDYFLAKEPANDISIDILDGSGKVIRSYTSYVTPKDTAKAKAEVRDMATGFYTRNSKAEIEKTKGMHRFVWDLDHRGPWDKNETRRYRGGPKVKPGEYTIALKVDGTTYQQKVNVLADPRIKASGITMEDLAAQEKLALQVRDLQDTCRKVADKVTTLKKELQKIVKEEKADDEAKDKIGKLTELERELITEEGTYMTPMLVDQLNYLASMLDQADQRPGKDAYDRHQELKARAEKVLSSYRGLAQPSGSR